MSNEATLWEILLPSFTLSDDGRSFTQNIASLNILFMVWKPYDIMNPKQTSVNIFTYRRIYVSNMEAKSMISWFHDFMIFFVNFYV